MAKEPVCPAAHTDDTSLINLFQAIGGAAKCHELATALYTRLAADPILRPMFPGKSQRCAIEAFAAFLAQLLGGPSSETQHRWWLSLRESHSRFQIGQRERDAWIAQMTGALREVEMSATMQHAVQQFFEDASRYLVNSGPAENSSRRKFDSPVGRQIEQSWVEQRALDEAVTAVRAGDLGLVLQHLESPLLRSRFERSRSVFAQFVAILIGSGHAALADIAEKILLAQPDLSCESYSGRTLLHAAAAAGHLPTIEALLKLGVNADIQDAGGHTPLYSVANECPGGGAAVKALAAAGANVNACDGVKRCTPLHMAARRGNVEAAQALLDCGAHIEARDSQGETPLRRAVNCGKTEIAALLLNRGADPHSAGTKGLTAVSAARSGKMRKLLQNRAHA